MRYFKIFKGVRFSILKVAITIDFAFYFKSLNLMVDG